MQPFRNSLMIWTMFVWCVLMVLVVAGDGFGGPRGTPSPRWILKSSLSRSDLYSFAEINGFKVIYESPKGLQVLEEDGPIPVYLDLFRDVKAHAGIERMEQLTFYNRSSRSAIYKKLGQRDNHFAINDSNWLDMWHASEDQFPSQGVYNSWLLGYSGAGIHVNVLDDGVEPDHPDLVDNYVPATSYDYLSNATWVNQTDWEYHGTWCAGLVSAAKNNLCVLGTAYRSTFSSVKIFDSTRWLDDYGESLALAHNHLGAGVYSNSWGPIDDGARFEGPGPLAMEALEKSIAEGRGGRGNIYTWAAGNGGSNDDCNADGYAGSRYTLSITAIGRDQGPSWYSEECSSIIAGTYSGDSPDLRIATTDTGGTCTTRFQGTSASCPIGAGIMALLLEANPELTWRDVQHLIALTSTRDGLIGANWQVNGAGLRVSHAFGFGILNAEALVTAAVSWENVSPEMTCESEMRNIDRTSTNGVYVSDTVASSGCGLVGFVEHVEVWIDFHSTYRGTLQIWLISPLGTRSRLLRPRQYDYYNGATAWTFMTLHSWGEVPNGEWTLQLETNDVDHAFGVNSWKLVMYGTATAPSYNPGPPGAQVSPTDDGDDGSTGYIVAGVIGGVSLFALVAMAAYIVLTRKAKDPTVYPQGDTSHNSRFNAGEQNNDNNG